MLSIGKVARRVGMRASAIRYYETQGLVPPAARGVNGYRFYSPNAVKLLLFVRRAQALGMTLKEIKPLLNLAARGQPPCRHVKQLARNHLREVEEKIRHLQMLRSELQMLLHRRAGRPHANEVCPIIERSYETLLNCRKKPLVAFHLRRLSRSSPLSTSVLSYELRL